MKTLLATIIIICSLAISALQAQQLSDDQIRQLLIEQSIRSYSGSCACPYSTMSNGRRCGGNSAYSKPGGAQPLCFPQDVSDAMVERYRAQH